MTPPTDTLPRTWRVTYWLVMVDLAVASALGWWIWYDGAERHSPTHLVATAALTALSWATVAGALRLTLSVVVHLSAARPGRLVKGWAA